MAINYAKAYQQFIDEELAAASATGWMTPAAGQIKYDGGKDIEIAELSTTGLGDYDATKTDGSAYPNGAVTSTWNTYQLTMDRGVKFSLDRTDPSDSGFIATAENVMREFARTQLTREQDSYRISKMFNLVSGGAHSATNLITGAITKTNAISELIKTVSAAQNSSERLDGFIAIVNQEHKAAFLESAANTVSQITFGNSLEINGIRYDNVMMVNDLPCIFAPSARMVTKVKALSGRGEETGGVAPDVGAKKINFLCTAFDAPIAVSKIDSLKQFGPNENQLFDGTAIQARYLYDLFLPANKIACASIHTVA